MADKRLVMAIFDNEAAAREAAAVLQDSGASVDDAIAVVVRDADGELQEHRVGATSGGKGAGAGFALALLGPVGPVVGAVGGALLGRLHHKAVGFDDADHEQLRASLSDGRAAVAVLAAPDELVAVESTLLDTGGTTDAPEFHAAARREATDSGG